MTSWAARRCRALVPTAALLLAACASGGRSTAANDPASLLGEAIAYAGGREALTRARALTWRGDAVVHAGGRDIPISGEWSILPPDTAVVATYAVAAGPGTTRSLVVAAPRGWTVSKGAFTPMPAPMLANERDEFYLYEILRLVPLRDPGVQLVALPRAADGARGFGVRRAGRPDVDVYLDATGRVTHLRTVVVHPMTGAKAAEELRFEGELVASGVRWPRVLRITLEGAPYFDLTMRDLKVLPRLDDPLLLGPR